MQYNRNKDTYEKISVALSEVNSVFMNANRETQKAMMLDSTAFAVISVQNSISILRRVFRGYCNANGWGGVKDALKSANYGNKKFEYIKHNSEQINSETGDEIIECLEYGDIWEAVEIMVEQFKGVSWIKAPFIGAMLGFTGLMCIDTNVAQMVPDTKASDYRSGEEYREAVRKVKDEFPELSSQVSIFMLQWVVFDSNRGTSVAQHEEWFEQMLPGSDFGRQQTITGY